MIWLKVEFSDFRNVLKRGGTAVDSAIATLFCNGLYSSHSMGIGGGFFMTMYNKETGIVETLDAREVASKGMLTSLKKVSNEKIIF